MINYLTAPAPNVEAELVAVVSNAHFTGNLLCRQDETPHEFRMLLRQVVHRSNMLAWHNQQVGRSFRVDIFEYDKVLRFVNNIRLLFLVDNVTEYTIHNDTQRNDHVNRMQRGLLFFLELLLDMFHDVIQRHLFLLTVLHVSDCHHFLNCFFLPEDESIFYPHAVGKF